MTDLGALLRQIIDQRIERLHVSVPGRIVSYDATSQRCSVQPMTTLRHGTDELPMPVLNDVPVSWPRGGGFVMHWPLAVGDVVDVRFSDRMLDDWRGTGQAVAPADPRSHALADATVHPSGVWPDASPATSPALTATDLMITRDGGGGLCIKADGTVVLGDVVGGVLAQPVTLDPVLRTQLLLLLPALNALSTSLVAMQTAIVGVAALTTAPPAAAIFTAASATVVAASSAAVAALSAWPAPTAATKTKAL